MFIQFPLDLFKGLAQAASNLGTVFALGAAAFWFFRTSKSKQRIQFDLGCKVYALTSNLNEKVAEIQFCFENKGFVEHRIYNLTVSVHSLKSEQELEIKSETGELQFHRRILAKTNIPPPLGEYYFIRPGIRQVITHIVPINAHPSLIRVTAGFYYVERGASPHTARRVFSTDTSHSAATPQVFAG